MPLDRPPLELSADFQYALNRIEEGANLFITGRAGTGKSTLLQLFRSTTRRKAVVLAPTGVAALNVSGQTIHSFFGFPPRLMQTEDIKRRRNRRLFERLELVVIDEISMVRADLVDHMDYFLRLNRDDPRPFGGVQVVVFGDLFQLPPVVASAVERELFSTRYSSPYFFAAHIIPELELEMVELQKVYRQEQPHFLRLLEAIRTNRLDRDDLDTLNERCEPDFDPPPSYLTLSARNAKVKQINQQKLDAIPMPARTYVGKAKGKFPPSQYPAEQLLQLKVGAQVMFVRNDPEKGFVNGSIGQVTNLNSETATIRLGDTGKSVEVGAYEWEINQYKIDPQHNKEISTEVVGTYRQLPIRLAWAVTIHKAQGKTFDRVVIDLGRGAFEHGQTYVALSRCRTLEGIVLRQPLRARDVQVDQRVVDFYLQHR